MGPTLRAFVAVSLLAGLGAATQRREGWAFIGTFAAILLAQMPPKQQ